MTGATGMVGSHVAAALLDGGHTLRCAVRRPEEPGLLAGLDVELVAADVTDAASLRRAAQGVEAVVHTAGMVSYDVADLPRLRAVNVEGTRNALDAAAAAGVRRFLLTSSIATVGYVEGSGLGDEGCAFNWGPFAIPYCDTKREAEALVLADERVEGIAVNPGIVLGTQDIHFNGGRILASVHRREVLLIPPGATTLCTAGDVARGHLLALERGAGGRRFILGGHPLTFLEVFRRVAAALGTSVPERVLPPTLFVAAAKAQAAVARLRGIKPAMDPKLAELSARDRRYSSARAEAELGYTISPLEPCIAEAYRWYLERDML